MAVLIPGTVIYVTTSVWTPLEISGQTGISKYVSPGRVLWLLFLITAGGGYVRFLIFQEKAQYGPQLHFRQVLLAVRKLALSFAMEIDRSTRAFQHRQEQSIPVTHPTYSSLQIFDFDKTLNTILYQIFDNFSEGNQNLERHFRVTLMVPQGDQLKIQYFANSDGEVPRTKAQDKGFRKKEGCAGWAWATGKTWIVSDVAKFRRESERAIQRGQEFPDYFVNVHEEHIRIMSIVSIPLAFKGYEGGEEVLGVINIDSDVRNFFKDSQPARDYLRRRIQPYIHIIIMLMKLNEFLKTAERRGVNDIR